MRATPEQIQRGLEKLVEALPEYSQADDLLIEAARAAVGPKQWIEDIDGREELKRDIYRALKLLGNVKLPDDAMIREDLEEIEKALIILQDLKLATMRGPEGLLSQLLLMETHILKATRRE